MLKSLFGVVRLRITAAKRYEKVANATAVIWKTLLVAEQNSRKLSTPELLAELADGVLHVNGIRVKTGKKQVPA